MEDFRREVREMSTADLNLILADQLDLYSPEEIEILREEFAARTDNTHELNANTEEQIRLEEERLRRIEAEKLAQDLRRKRMEEEKRNLEAKISNLKNKGYEGYYEYTTLSLTDNNDGDISVDRIADILNEYAMDGWRLVNSYSNQIGRVSKTSGFGMFATEINAIIDQHILILERYVKI